MWWVRRPRRSPEVVVVSRDGCHLCGEMVGVVRRALPRLPVRILDLDRARKTGDLDDMQHERWTTMVPVLLVDGEEVAHYRVDAQTVRRAVRR